MHRLVLAATAVAVFASSQVAQAKNVFLVGHSLVNFTMPHMVQKLAESGPAVNHTYRSQIMNGSPLMNNWTNAASAQGYNARTEIPGGAYDVLIVTEAVPLQNHLTWSNTYVAADNYYDLAVGANGNALVYIYETWHCINSGVPGDSCWYDNGDNVAWRQRLRDDLPKWEGIADTVNLRNSGPDMLVVPGGQALGALDDAIRAGNGGGLLSIRDVFADDIHLNNTGWYYIACVMYATIYARTPVGLTNHILGQYGEEVLTVNSTLALRLQQLAWQTVSQYPRAWADVTAAARPSNAASRGVRRAEPSLYSLTGQRAVAGRDASTHRQILLVVQGSKAQTMFR